MFLVVKVCLSVCLWITLLKKLLTDLDEVLWRYPSGTIKNIKFW